ncbi:hypothetical protein CEP52_015067 [Fusarium oligoseptatum]|uniref:Uncharacterized protein n=1 Tax=Fusarium oligoseptatum TaxID=2604345 RepID=A0A428SGE9_9HYPO|nr:hypothetical protein CEP52_015067 [Fusarium oligoseptatum]
MPSLPEPMVARILDDGEWATRRSSHTPLRPPRCADKRTPKKESDMDMDLLLLRAWGDESERRPLPTVWCPTVSELRYTKIQYSPYRIGYIKFTARRAVAAITSLVSSPSIKPCTVGVRQGGDRGRKAFDLLACQRHERTMPPLAGEDRQGDNNRVRNTRNHLNLPALRGYVERLTNVTREWVDWSEPDEWKKRLANTIKISPAVENRPFLEVLGANGIEVVDDIACFIQSSLTSARWDRRVSHIERFCAGAGFALLDTIPVDPVNSQLEARDPEAWVSDRNQVVEALAEPPPDYPRILNNNELFQVLQKKRFPEGSQGDIVVPPRRIYITNPNGSSVLAIVKTTPASQVEGFRDLFAGYITPTPEPKFVLRVSDWWCGCFVISFDIPYYGISSRELQDSRTISNSGKRLRSRQDLDFLLLKGHGLSDEESSSFHDEAMLHAAVYSLAVTGKGDKYWTAACLDDDFFDEEPRLASDEETLELDGKMDPILLKAEGNPFKAEGNTTKSPRAYALAALAIALYKTVEHHGNIQDWFKASLSLLASDAEDGSRDRISAKERQNWLEKFPRALNFVIHANSSLIVKLDHFLEEDVMFGQDALPRGVLWQSLQRDADALNSLLRIKQYRNELRGIDGELRQMVVDCEEVRRKRKNDNEGEQHIMTRQVYQVALAAFGFTILNTVAQLYSAKPDKDDSASRTSYLVMVMLCVLAAVAIAVCSFWQQVRRWSRHVVAFLSETFQTVRRHIGL